MICQGIVEAFAKANAKAIVLVARNADQLKETEEDVRKINSQVQVLSVPTSVTDEDSVKQLYEKVKATFGTADVLVNNAGTANGLGTLDVADTKSWWGDFVRLSFPALPWASGSAWEMLIRRADRRR